MGVTTIVPIDSTSTWAAPAANPQQYDITINPGYEGKLYFRLNVAKPQAVPDSVYLDPMALVV